MCGARALVCACVFVGLNVFPTSPLKPEIHLYKILNLSSRRTENTFVSITRTNHLLMYRDTLLCFL